MIGSAYSEISEALAANGDAKLTASPEEVRSLFEVSVVGLVAFVQAAHADLKSEKGALLITNGGAGFIDPGVDAAMVQYGLMGLGVSNAAKHKLVGLLATKLTPDGIYVGEIMISGSIKGTPFDQGQATIEGKTVAARYWELYTARKELRTLKGHTGAVNCLAVEAAPGGGAALQRVGRRLSGGDPAILVHLMDGVLVADVECVSEAEATACTGACRVK